MYNISVPVTTRTGNGRPLECKHGLDVGLIWLMGRARWGGGHVAGAQRPAGRLLVDDGQHSVHILATPAPAGRQLQLQLLQNGPPSPPPSFLRGVD